LYRLLLAATVAALAWSQPAAPPALDAAFARFWQAKSPQDAAKAARDIVKTRASFDDVWKRLEAGRLYSGTMPTGVIRGQRSALEGAFGYTLDIPPTYDPGRKYQVRIQLHGGVMRREDGSIREARGAGRLAGAEQIYVLPVGWRDATWWTRAQIENLHAILDSVKRSYNVDENRVAVSGVSDGATGAFYVAMRDTTPYTTFLPLNGLIVVLGNDDAGVEGDLFPGNLANKPFFIVNGGRDPLYPAAAAQRYVDHLRRGGVSIVYKPQPAAGHDTSWWPEVKDDFETFVREHPRLPLPDRLTWETSDVRSAGRAHWLVIDKLGSRPSDASTLADLNDLGDGRSLFRHRARSGRIDVVRKGNSVEAATRGVAEFTVLLSPAQFDFGRPVTIVANAQTAFDGRVEKSVATLMKWAARDNDRTMLFGAEISVKVR
jgi:hypothetical protein